MTAGSTASGGGREYIYVFAQLATLSPEGAGGRGVGVSILYGIVVCLAIIVIKLRLHFELEASGTSGTRFQLCQIVLGESYQSKFCI